MAHKFYLENKAKGLCRRCGAPPLEGKTRCGECHAAHLAYQRKAKEKLEADGVCRWCGVTKRLPAKSMCGPCLDKHRAKETRRYADMRKNVIEAYGGRCVCCRTTVTKYLQLDHVNNDGAAHRKELTGDRKGGSIYVWAQRNDHPPTLQLLCANCHQAKTTCGGCDPQDHP